MIALFPSAVFAYCSALLASHPYFDGDLFWQRYLGEWILAHHALPRALGPEVFSTPGAPWVPQEWLFSVVVALAYRMHGLWVLALLCGAAVGASVGIAAYRARAAGASAMATAASIVFGLPCLNVALGIRAQIVVWPLFSTLLLLLDSGRVGWALVLLVLWSNVHASAVLGVLIVWLDTAAWVWIHRGPTVFRIGRSRLICAALAPLALLATPLWWRMPAYAIALVQSPIRRFIIEWQPGYEQTVIFWLAFLPLLGLVVWGVRLRWRNSYEGQVRDLFLAAVLAIASVYAMRNFSLFALAAIPLAAVSLERGSWHTLFVHLRVAAAGVAVVLILGGAAGWYAARAEPRWAPASSVLSAVDALPGDRRVYCADFAYCSLILGSRHGRVFLDGRADPFPYWVWQENYYLAYPSPDVLVRLERDRVNTVVALRASRLSWRLQSSKAWREVPVQDGCCELFAAGVSSTHPHPLPVLKASRTGSYGS